ncbi:PKD domain-containing protein, partial [Bacteroidota bacterium]
IQDPAIGSCWDTSGDQIVPIDVPGKEYIVMKGPLPAAYDEKVFIYPIDDTEIEVDGAVIPGGPFNRLNPAVVIVPPASEAIHIKGVDTSLYVFHITGTSCELGGALLPTIDGCTGSLQVTYFRSNTDDFWLMLMTKTGNEDGFVFEYEDGSTFNLPSGWFTPVGATGWMVLKNLNYKFADAIGGGIPQGQATKIINTKDVFHLGVVNGWNGRTCKYGYFSDFVQEPVSGKVVQSSSTFGEVCENNPLQLFASGGKSYSWSPVDFLDDPTSATPWVTLPAGPHSYAVTIERPCTGDTVLNMSINSIPVPNASFTLSDYTVCAPYNLGLYNNSDVASNQQDWNFNYDNNPFVFDTTTTDPIDTITHWFYNNTNSDTTFNIRLLTRQAGNPCIDTFFNQIHVKPEIHAGFDQDNLIGCNPLLVQFTDTSSGNLDQYKWTFGDGGQETVPSPDHEYKHVFINDTIDYDVELVVTSPYFCKDTARATISVFPYLEGGFTIDKDEGCSPYNVSIENVSSGADSIFLDYGDGNIDTLLSFSSINHTYRNNDGVDEVDTNIIVMRVKNDEGCEFTDRDTVLVYPEITADYIIDGPGNYEGCNSRTVTFDNTTIDGVHVASRYLWEFDDGTSMDTTINTIDKFYNNTTTDDKTYNFRLTARSIYGCTDDTTNSIDIYRAYANFTVDNNEGCSPVNVSVTNISIGNQITNWDWDYGDATGTSTDEDPFPYMYNNTSAANETNKLMLVVTGTAGCSTKDSVDIVVYPGIKATYTIAETPVTSCDSLIVDFDSDIIHLGLEPTTVYTWAFGDGASASIADPRHVYKNLASATLITRRVDLHVETPLGCSYDTSSFIDVYPLVDANISIDQNSGCSPLTVDAIATEYIGINSYNWDYDDLYTTNVSNPPAHIYPVNDPLGGDDTYTLRLDVSDLTGTCTDFDTEIITVYAESLADFDPKNSTDCNPYSLTFDNLSQNSATYKWDFDDGGTTSTDFEPTYEFVNTTSGPIIFSVELEATSNDGCTDLTSSNVNVLPFVIADFDIDFSEGCSPLTVTVDNNSAGGTYRWYWDSSDGAGVEDYSSANSNEIFNHIYANQSGVDQIVYLTLIAENASGCADTTTIPITVYSETTADFNPQGSIDCNPYSVTFDNLSFNAASYQWDFNDGVSSNAFEPTHVFTNISNSNKPFNVKLEVTSNRGCTHDTTALVRVYRYVDANFDISVSEGCAPLTVEISNNSAGGNYRWYWNSVDGSGAADYTSANASEVFNHTYTNSSGVTDINNLMVISDNGNGCYDTLIRTVTVHTTIDAQFTVDPVSEEGCNPLTVDFTNSTFNGSLYSWSFGDGSSTTTESPTHQFINTTTGDVTFDVRMDAESINGCTDYFETEITVYSKVISDFSIATSEGCPPFNTS